MNAAFLNLYWSLLIIAFGLCVGSFLNVVIYRWPRDLSIRRPLWSFCPSCRHTLHWRDNLPVLSYVRLGGRCRYCRTPISLQYPLVEIATAFTFLLIFDAFFVAKLRVGISDPAVDWPMLMAHWGLAAGLVVLTVMDLEAYLVDIRVTWIMTGLGLILHAIWTPAIRVPEQSWMRPGAYLASLTLAAVVGLIIAAAIWLRRPATAGDPDADTETHPTPDGRARDSAPLPDSSESPGSPDLPVSPVMSTQGEPSGTPADVAPPFRANRYWIAALFGLALMAAYVAAMVWQDYQAWARIMEPPRDLNGRLVWPDPPKIEPGVIRTASGLALLFVALVAFASHPHPEEDEGIVEAINSEASDSRRNALSELVFLSPALLLMVTAGIVLTRSPGLTEQIDQVLSCKAIGHWQPLLGLTTALSGWMIGGAIAWATRILGTLGLGKEAFGMGDVHILAAIGAIAGGMVAFVGFFAASILALLGMMVILFRRQGRAVPYGPWLALASYIVVIYQDKIIDYFQVH